MSEKIVIKYVTSDNRTIVLSERNDLPESLSPLERKRDKREVITLWAILATLAVYGILAWLQYQANVLNKKATIIAHTPWLSVDQQFALTPFPDDKTLEVMVQFKNPSETPILNLRAHILVTPQNAIPCYDIKNIEKAKIVGTIMPQETLSGTLLLNTDAQITKGTDFSANKMIRDILGGAEITFLYISYQDVFSETIYEEFEFQCNPVTEKMDLKKMTVTGFTTF